jgi:muconate cycloisomerase
VAHGARSEAVKITGFQAYLVQLPARRVHNWASKMSTPIGHHYVLRVTTDAGIDGWGEAPAIATWGGPHGAYFGETAMTVDHIVADYLLPALADTDPRDIGACHVLMDRAIKGHPYAKAAVDLALHDLAGKAAGAPVYRLLGGKVRDGIPVCHSLGIMDADAALDEAQAACAEGIRTIKCKTGLDPRRDIRFVESLRQGLGPEIGIRVDANEGYASAREAARITRAMEAQGILFCEQPVAGFEALAEAARLISVPIMADESAWFAQDVLRLWQLRAAQIISLYYSKPGGLYRARQVADVARACGMTCDIGGSIEMGIGVAANVHLGVAVEALAWASVCPVPNVDGAGPTTLAGVYYRDDIIREPFRYEHGVLCVPDRPGLGVEVDEEKLNRYGRRLRSSEA